MPSFEKERRSPEDDMTTIDTHDPYELLEMLRDDDVRWQAAEALRALGPAALPAVREGLGHANWQVRRACAIWFDHNGSPESLPLLIPLLHDPKSKVRLFAIHSLACDQCKEGENPVDAVQLLMERIREDESIRVRRHATSMLAWQHAHPDLEGFFQDLVETETDRKLHKWAAIGVYLCRKKAAEEGR